jgi:hypothetical protein
MRLGQLARKLTLNTTEIVEFLASRNIQIETGSNTRLEDEHVKWLIQHFAPAMAEEMAAEQESKAEEIVIEKDQTVEGVLSEVVAEETTVIDQKQSQQEQVTAVLDIPKAIEDANDESIEIIKASKVELPGLKVIGKIDLPEPKKKIPVLEEEVQSENSQGGEIEKPRPVLRKAPYQKRERIEPRQWKNPIALQREQEAEELERQKRARAQQEKEKRTQNYLKKVKSAPTKPVKRYEDPAIDVFDEKEKPKTWLGKLKQWFTT